MGEPTTHHGNAQGLVEDVECEYFSEGLDQEDLDGEPWEQPCDHWELPTPASALAIDGGEAVTNTAVESDTTLPRNHAKRPSSTGFGFVEIFSGLGAFTMMLLALGGSLLGYCENNPASYVLFQHKFPDVCHVKDYMDFDGYEPILRWCYDHNAEVGILAAGPSCKSYSVAGKQDWDNPRALCAPNTAKVVGKIRPKVAMVEITVELLTNNHKHGLFTLMVNNFEAEGYVLASVEMVRDSELGGNQSRRRLITTWERADFHAALPPVPSIFEFTSPPCPIRELLEPLDSLPAYCWLRGKVSLNSSAKSPECKLYPIQVATISWGGPRKPLREGSIISVSSWGPGTWRVVQVAAQKVRIVRPNTPTDQRCHWVFKSAVTHECQIEKVYSIHGVSIPIRTWGETLGGAGMLVLDDRAGPHSVRSLVPVERWRIQGKTMDDWDLLAAAGLSEIQRAKLAGESIPTAMSSAVSQRAVDRLHLHQILTAQQHVHNTTTSEQDDSSTDTSGPFSPPTSDSEDEAPDTNDAEETTADATDSGGPSAPPRGGLHLSLGEGASLSDDVSWVNLSHTPVHQSVLFIFSSADYSEVVVRDDGALPSLHHSCADSAKLIRRDGMLTFTSWLLLHVMQVRANRNLSSNLIGQDASSTAALGQPLAIYSTMAHEKPNGPKYASSKVWVFCLC